MEATYTYDALNRRIEVQDSGGSAFFTAYDGKQVYADFNTSGTLLTRNLYGPAVDEILARTSSGGTTAWYLTDHLGSVRNIVDTSGNLLDDLAYDGYGNKTFESNSANGDRYGYAGMQWDGTVHLYFDQARWYDPVTGRFIELDPTGFAAGDPNLYRYVGNGPTNKIDPSGFEGKNKNQLDIGEDEQKQYLFLIGAWSAWWNLKWAHDWAFNWADKYVNWSTSRWTDTGILKQDLESAARHAVGMTATALLYGKEVATQIGNIHEYNNKYKNKNQLDIDTIMDQYNNAQARKLAEEISKMEGYSEMSWLEVQILLLNLK